MTPLPLEIQRTSDRNAVLREGFSLMKEGSLRGRALSGSTDSVSSHPDFIGKHHAPVAGTGDFFEKKRVVPDL